MGREGSAGIFVAGGVLLLAPLSCWRHSVVAESVVVFARVLMVLHTYLRLSPMCTCFCFVMWCHSSLTFHPTLLYMGCYVCVVVAVADGVAVVAVVVVAVLVSIASVVARPFESAQSRAMLSPSAPSVRLFICSSLARSCDNPDYSEEFRDACVANTAVYRVSFVGAVRQPSLNRCRFPDPTRFISGPKLRTR